MSLVTETPDRSPAQPVRAWLRISLIILALSMAGAAWHHHLGADATDAFCRDAEWLFPDTVLEALDEAERAAQCQRAITRSLFFLASVAAFGAVALLLLASVGTAGASRDGRGLPQSARGAGDALRSAPVAVDWALLLGLTYLGLLLRLPVLNVGMWRDEASTYFNSILPGWESFFERLIYSELNPPAYYLIMRQWIEWFGGDDIALKMPSLIFGLLLIPATYALGRVVGSRPVGLIAASLVMVSPEAISQSQEARPYTLAALLATIAVAFFIRSLREERPAWSLTGFVLAATLLIYAHYTGLMLLGALGAIAGLFVLWRRDLALVPRFAAAFAAIFILYLPWLGTFLVHLGTGTPWTPEESWLERPVLLVKNIGYPIAWEANKYLVSLLVVVILLAMAASLRRFLLPGRAAPGRRADPELEAVVVGAIYLGTAVMLTVLSYSGRYMFAFLPIASAFYAIWICRVGSFLAERRLVHPVPALLVVLYGWAAAAAWPHATADAVPKSGIRAFASEIGTWVDEDALYLVSPDYMGPTFGYYTRGQDVEFYGFARRDDPHIFSPLGYAAVWSRPDALAETEALIRQRASEGRRRLVLVTLGCDELSEDRGAMLYSRSEELFARLTAAYPMLEERSYPGDRECVSVHVFDITRSP